MNITNKFFAPGTKVKVTQAGSGHDFKIGDILTIEDVRTDEEVASGCRRYVCSGVDRYGDREVWFLNPEEVVGLNTEQMPCQSCNRPGGTTELHTCPYASDIHDNEDPICNCCDSCCQECGDSI